MRSIASALLVLSRFSVCYTVCAIVNASITIFYLSLVHSFCMHVNGYFYVVIDIYIIIWKRICKRWPKKFFRNNACVRWADGNDAWLQSKFRHHWRQTRWRRPLCCLRISDRFSASRSQSHCTCKQYDVTDILLPPSRRRLCDQCGLAVIPSVCQQDYCKSNKPISLKLGVMIRPTTLKNGLTFGDDPVSDTDFGFQIIAPLF